jgi:Flp pilus assembly pilin Flp
MGGFVSFLHDDSGQDLIEYALLLGFLTLVAIAFVLSTGTSVAGAWDEGSEILESAKAKAS